MEYVAFEQTDNVLDTVKPTCLIRQMLEIATRPNEADIVFDFFAGSCSTVHAVFEQNLKDSGNRRFVLVQPPEPLPRPEPRLKITDITKERVRRVIQKLNDEDSQKTPQQSLALPPTPALPLKWGGSGSSVPSKIKNLSGGERNSLKNKGSGGIVPSPCEGEGRDGGADVNKGNSPDRGFKVFKLAESNFNPWNADVPHEAGALEQQLDLHVDHIREGRTADDLFYELLLKSGFPLTTPVERSVFDGRSLKSSVFSVQQEQRGDFPSAGKIEHRKLNTENSALIYRIAGGLFIICLEQESTLELIRAIAEQKPERVVCLDDGFAGNDRLKANAVQIFKTKGIISFKTV